MPAPSSRGRRDPLKTETRTTMEERTINPETTECVELIRRIVGSYIDHPEALEIEALDFRDEVRFEIKGHTDDMRRLVGTGGGAHVAALEFLVKQMGRARQVVHKLRLLEPDPGVRREEYPSPTATSFDPTPMTSLIRDMVLACGLDEAAVVPSFESAPAELPISILFQIFTRTSEDYESLIVSPPRARNGLTVEIAIAILLRAAAKKAGVKMDVKAVNPTDNK